MLQKYSTVFTAMLYCLLYIYMLQSQSHKNENSTGRERGGESFRRDSSMVVRHLNILEEKRIRNHFTDLGDEHPC